MQLVEDVEDEAKRYGAMQAVFVPRPPPTVTPDEPARVFIRSVGAVPEAAVKIALSGMSSACCVCAIMAAWMRRCACVRHSDVHTLSFMIRAKANELSAAVQT